MVSEHSASVSVAAGSAIALARRLRHGVFVGMVLAGLGLVSSPWWMDGSWLLKSVSAQWQLQAQTPVQAPIAFARWMAWAGLCLPWWAGLLGLMGVWRLLGQFQQGHLLDFWSAVLLHRIGWVLVVMGPLHALGNSLALSAVTWSNPPGQRLVGIALQPEHATLLVLGALLILLGRVLTEAARVEEDHRGFV